METRNTRTVVEVDMVCDQCGIGKMRPERKEIGHLAAEHLQLDPPSYPHRCEHCGYLGAFRYEYPHVVYDDGQVAGE